MTDDQIAALVSQTAEETARRVIHEMFTAHGIDVASPLAMQADMQHLRAWRNASEAIKRQGLVTMVGIFVVGMLGLIWSALHAAPPAP